MIAKNRATREVIGHQLGELTRQGLHQGQNLLVLDLTRCTRCQECVRACSDSHDGVSRLVLEGERFDEYLVPSACRSCHDPVCLIGCPVDAIHRRPSDPRHPKKTAPAVVIEDHCIGCGPCAHTCPWLIRCFRLLSRRWSSARFSGLSAERSSARRSRRVLGPRAAGRGPRADPDSLAPEPGSPGSSQPGLEPPGPASHGSSPDREKPGEPGSGSEHHGAAAAADPA